MESSLRPPMLPGSFALLALLLLLAPQAVAETSLGSRCQAKQMRLSGNLLRNQLHCAARALVDLDRLAASANPDQAFASAEADLNACLTDAEQRLLDSWTQLAERADPELGPCAPTDRAWPVVEDAFERLMDVADAAVEPLAAEGAAEAAGDAEQEIRAITRARLRVAKHHVRALSRAHAAFIRKQDFERLDRLVERAWRWSTRRWRRVGGALGESTSSLGTIEWYVQDRYPSVTGMSYQRFREMAWQIQHGLNAILTLYFVAEPEPAWRWFGLGVWEPQDRH